MVTVRGIDCVDPTLVITKLNLCEPARSGSVELSHIVEVVPTGLSLNPTHTLAGSSLAVSEIVSLLPGSRLIVIGYDSDPPVESVPAGFDTTTEYR